MKPTIAIGLLLVANLHGRACGEFRTWTADTGTQVQAEFVSLAEDGLVLLKTTQGEVPVKYSRLSSADQQFVMKATVRNLAKANEKLRIVEEKLKASNARLSADPCDSISRPELKMYLRELLSTAEANVDARQAVRFRLCLSKLHSETERAQQAVSKLASTLSAYELVIGNGSMTKAQETAMLASLIKYAGDGGLLETQRFWLKKLKESDPLTYASLDPEMKKLIE